MLKKDLIKAVAEKSGHTEKTVRELIEVINAVVHSAVASGGSAMLLGLGKLSVSRRGEKTARNLHTGEKVMVPPRNVVTFRPSESLNDAVNVSVA